jgi:acyl-CoA synthetase (NDP forming)
MTKRLLSESEGYALLDAAGIPYPRHQLATDAAGAKDAATAIGYPVVLKIVSADIVHKSDVGGVAVGIRDEEELGRAYERMMAAAAERMPDAKVQGVIVEEELPHGLELIVGGTIDPAFGRVLTFGIGGTMVELLRDVSTRVLPLSDAGIRDMIRSIHGYPLIRGYRGGPPLDEDALVGSIRAAQELFLSHDGIVEFDINPLILYPDRVCAVDARIYLEDGTVSAAVPDKAPCDPARTRTNSDMRSCATSSPSTA